MTNQILAGFAAYLKKEVFRYPVIARIAKYLLSSTWVTENPLYDSIYQKKIALDREKGKVFPQTVQIELTNHCNADCIMCPRRLMKRPKGVMELAVFKNIVAECAEYNTEIVLNGYGESLLDKGFSAKVVYAREVFPGRISLFTNGALLNEAVASALVENRIDAVSISVDSAQPEQYQEIRCRLCYQDVIQNIDGLLEKKKRLNSCYPWVTVTMVNMEQNKSNIKLFRKYFKNKVDAVYIQNLKNWGGELTGADDRFHSRTDYSKRVACHYLWKNMAILWNGDVSLCCQDFDGQVILGNTKDSSLKEIWSGPALAKYRTAHMEKRFNDISICGNCSYHSVWW
jgi:radical SAM protein with 4Fe4S-binding SPASM domain